MNRYGLGVAVLIATAALWGANHVVARAVHDLISLPALVFWRWFIAAVLLTMVALPSLRRCAPAMKEQLPQICLGGVLGVGVFSFLLLGGAYASPALEVGIINATTPVWVMMLGLAIGTAAASLRASAGLTLAFLGTIAIISKGRLEDLLALQFSVGNLWSLLGAMTFAWFSLRVRAWSKTIEPLALTVATAWSGILIVMLPAYAVSLAANGAWLLKTDGDLSIALAAVVFIGLGPTMLGNLFYLYGVSVVGPERAASYLYLTPIFSAVMAIAWLNESFAWYHTLGIVLILGGLLLIPRE